MDYTVTLNVSDSELYSVQTFVISVINSCPELNSGVSPMRASITKPFSYQNPFTDPDVGQTITLVSYSFNGTTYTPNSIEPPFMTFNESSIALNPDASTSNGKFTLSATVKDGICA